MIQSYRILIIGILVLTQLFAPLVHAHAGGARTSGVMHVPGLEYLSTRDGAYAQDRGERLSPEVIVALSPGLKCAADVAVPSSDHPQPATLPALAFRCDTQPPGLPGCAFQPHTQFPERVFQNASPRAPPA
ncbi:MAG: hypothetical protein H6R26_384 [Proteobacteria bacterium]|nr:hypothetical protein [Pseudomonadota bacterium]